MATNLHIDSNLLAEAQKLAGLKTKRETVNAALKEYVQHKRQMEIIKLFGTIDFDPSYDYKAQRRRDVGMRRSRAKKCAS